MNLKEVIGKRKVSLVLLISLVISLFTVGVVGGEVTSDFKLNDYITLSKDSRWLNKNKCLVGYEGLNPDEAKECVSVYEIKAKDLSLLTQVNLDKDNFGFSYRSEGDLDLVDSITKNEDWKDVWFWINTTKSKQVPIYEEVSFDCSYTTGSVENKTLEFFNKSCSKKAKVGEKTVIFEGWLPFDFNKSNLQEDVKIGVTGRKKTGSNVDNILNLKLEGLDYKLSDLDWWNSSWKGRINVSVANPDSTLHRKQAIFVDLNPIKLGEGCEELRILNMSNSLMVYDILINSSIRCWIHFTDDLEANEQRDYWIYYNSSSVVPDGHTEYMIWYQNFSQSNCSAPTWFNDSSQLFNATENYYWRSNPTCLGGGALFNRSDDSDSVQLYPNNSSMNSEEAFLTWLYSHVTGEFAWLNFDPYYNIGNNRFGKGSRSGWWQDLFNSTTAYTLTSFSSSTNYTVGLFMNSSDARQYVTNNVGSTVDVWWDAYHNASKDVSNLYPNLKHFVYKGGAPGTLIILHSAFLTNGPKSFLYQNNPIISISAPEGMLFNVTEGEARTIMDSSAYQIFSTPIMHTDFKIVQRLASQTQNLAVFDKVYRLNNQVWAVNYIQDNDTYSNMVNITPYFYVWEDNTNRTGPNLTITLEQFFSSTKT